MFPQEYVAGLLFRGDKREVALIEKRRPEWQRGKLNGIGGKVEPGEEPLQAMHREFREEAGGHVCDWMQFAVARGSAWIVHWFVCCDDTATLKQITDETVDWYATDEVPILPTVEHLCYLVPLALECLESKYNQRTFAPGESSDHFKLEAWSPQ